MSQDEFTRLFKYMTERFDRIDKTLDEKSNSADISVYSGYLMNDFQKSRQP